ncbi:UDP-N-acetylmuramoyl-tripeptide--D-alanyl-D-alanine ligase [bacterium]|nr:UDP-N-acetylmuramoyl-tripeptide--D-alanyl-D-alanine ligase [bacterium]
MKIGEAARELGWELRSVNPTMEIPAFSNDSRNISPGEIFWGLKGTRDGCEFAGDALEKRAGAVVVNRRWADKLPSGSPIIVVSNIEKALAAYGSLARSKFKGKVFALTGSCGKTTVKELLYQVLSKKYRVIRSQASYNNHIGVPFTLNLLNDKLEIAVIEMGANHPGEIAELCEIARPSAGLITMVGRAHMAGFTTLKGVAEAKGELFRGLIGPKLGFVNFDDAYIVGQSDILPHRLGYGFGLPPAGKGFARLYRAAETSDGFNLLNNDYKFPFPPFMMIHAVSAAAVGHFWGVETENIADALAKFEGLPGRMRRIVKEGIIIYDDTYNSNPSSLKAALQYISGLKAGRKIAALGDMRELGNYEEMEHKAAVKLLQELDFDKWFTCGEAFSKIEGACYCSDKDEMTHEIVKYLREGDIVLFKGSRANRIEHVMNEVLKMINPNAPAARNET